MSVLEGAVQASEPWMKLWGALGLTRAGQAVPYEVFQQIAAWSDCRITLARELKALGRPDLFPNDFLNQPSLAEATMVDWLLFPTELGRAPDEMQQLQVMPIETDDGFSGSLRLRVSDPCAPLVVRQGLGRSRCRTIPH
jgi:hypothetical protein